MKYKNNLWSGLHVMVKKIPRKILHKLMFMQLSTTKEFFKTYSEKIITFFFTRHCYCFIVYRIQSILPKATQLPYKVQSFELL